MYGCQGNQVSMLRRCVLTSLMSLPSFNLIGQQTTELLQGLCFQLFRVFVFQLFKMLGNTGMVAKATKFLCLEDVS